MSVHALKGKWLKLSIIKLADIQYIAVTWHALTKVYNYYTTTTVIWHPGLSPELPG